MRVYGTAIEFRPKIFKRQNHSPVNESTNNAPVQEKTGGLGKPAMPLASMGTLLKAQLGSNHPVNMATGRSSRPQAVRFGQDSENPQAPSPLRTLEEAITQGLLPTSQSTLGASEKAKILTQVEKDGFLRMPPQKAMDTLCQDPPFVLDIIKAAARSRKTLAPDGSLPLQTVSPVKGKAITWFAKTHHHVLNIANLTVSSDPKEKGDIWKAVVYLLTSPEGGYHLTPWHEKDLNSNYIPNNPFQIDPGIESPVLKRIGIRGNNQLKLLADVANLLGKPIWYDILPHAAHFGTPVLAHPENFRWIQFDLDKIRSLPSQGGQGEEVKELYSYDDLRQKINSGASAQDIDNFVNHRIQETGIVKTRNQQEIISTVKAIVRKHLGNPSTPISPQGISNEQRIAITQELIQKGLWTLPRHGYNAWNFTPLVRGYNLSGNYPLYQVLDRGDKGNANGQMFPFTRLAFLNDQGQPRDEVINYYISQAEFADKLGLSSVLRLDQVDWLNREGHVYDPFPAEAIRRLRAKFPDKPIVAERLDSYDKEPYRQVGVNAVVGDDWRKEVSDPYFHENAWGDQYGTLEYSKRTNSFITGLNAFEVHDQHMQPYSVSPFDPARGGFRTGQGRFLTFLFLNGDQGTNKPFYDIMGDEVGLPGEQVYKGGFTPGAVIDLTDKNNFYTTYVNAKALRYGTPQIRKAQEALRSNDQETLRQMDEGTLYSAKALTVLENGRKTWSYWSNNSDVVAWGIEPTNGDKGVVVVVANRHRADGSRPPSDITVPKAKLGQGKGAHFILDNPEGINTQPVDVSNQDLKVTQLPPSGVQLYYFE